MYLQINALWPAVAAAVNRDGSNQQKTTVYGGTRRARWSSQSQKFSTRAAFRTHLQTQYRAVRTRQHEPIAQELAQAGWDPLTADKAAARLYALVSGGEGKAMVMVREDFPRTAAHAMITHADAVHDDLALTTKKPTKEASDEEKAFYQRYQQRKVDVEAAFAHKTTGRAAKGTHTDAIKSLIESVLNADGNVDIAFNGRMIAENDGYNIDAAIDVAHAISVDPWNREENLDFFTAVDDLTGKPGMVSEKPRPNGTVLYYRTAQIALGKAHATLGGEWDPIVTYASWWANEFTRALPVSMQSSTYAASAPVFAAVTAAPTPLSNLVEFCAEPITGRNQYREAASTLIEQHRKITTGFGVPATMHYWTSLDLDPITEETDTPTSRAHATWDAALGAAAEEARTRGGRNQ